MKKFSLFALLSLALVSVACAPEDEFEDNDTIEAAIEIPEDGLEAVVVQDDPDFFFVEAEAGDLLDLDFHSFSVIGGLNRFSLVTPAGVELLPQPEDDDTFFNQLDCEAPPVVDNLEIECFEDPDYILSLRIPIAEAGRYTFGVFQNSASDPFPLYWEYSLSFTKNAE